MDKAYELAKGAGYEGRLYSDHGELLDPLFWQSLGKALGWQEVNDNMPYTYMWHRFIDHLAENKSPDSFFTALLNNEKQV